MRRVRFQLPFVALLLCTLATLTTPAATTAQAVGGSQSRLATLFGELSPGAQLQIVTPQMMVEGVSFEGVDGNSVRVSQNGNSVPINMADIRVVSVGDNHPLQGSLWGLGGGLLVGGAFGMLVGSFTCTNINDCSTEERQGAVIGAVGLGLIGATVGFIIGRNRFSWNPIFP